MGNLKILVLNSMKMFETEFHERLFDKHVVCFLCRILVFKITLHIFIIRGQYCCHLNHMNLLLQQDSLTKWCMNITYNLCASFWVQVLPWLLLNPQHFNKYFNIFYSIFHIFIDLNVYIGRFHTFTGHEGPLGRVEV